MEYITSKMRAEIEGKEYVVFKASKRILGEDGRNIKREEIWIEAVELRSGEDFESIESSLNSRGLAGIDASRHRVTGSVNINSAGGLQGLQAGKLGEIQDEMLRAFAPNTENRQNEHFSILVSNDRSEPQFLEGALPIKGVEMKIAGIQESNQATSYPIKGIIGVGLLTIEDVVLAKEFLASEEFKIYLSDVKEGFLEGFVDMGKSAIDLAKIGIKYGLEPSAITMLRIALAVDKFRKANAGKEWEVVKEGAWKVAQETWRNIVESTTTGKGHGRIFINFEISNLDDFMTYYIPNIMFYAYNLSEEVAVENYYCGLEPAIDQETRFFTKTEIGPLKVSGAHIKPATERGEGV